MLYIYTVYTKTDSVYCSAQDDSSISRIRAKMIGCRGAEKWSWRGWNVGTEAGRLNVRLEMGCEEGQASNPRLA